MPSAAHRVPACRRIHGRTRSLRTLSTRHRSPRRCQPDLVRDEFAASLTCTRHLRQADCSALSPRDALLSHDLCPQLRAPLSHAETRSSSHTLLPLCSLTASRSPHPSPALSPISPAVTFSPSHPMGSSWQGASSNVLPDSHAGPHTPSLLSLSLTLYSSQMRRLLRSLISTCSLLTITRTPTNDRWPLP